MAAVATLLLSPSVGLAQDAGNEPPQLLQEVIEAGRQIESATRMTSARCPSRGRALRASFAPLLRRARARVARFAGERSTDEARNATLRELFEILDRVDALLVRAADCGEAEALHAAVRASSARDALAVGGLVDGQERDIALASTDPGAGPLPDPHRAMRSRCARPRGDVEVIGPATSPHGFEARFAQTFRASMPAMRRCYERALLVTPSLRGEAALRLTVGVHGRVEGADLTWLAEPPLDLGACVTGVARRLVFTSLRGPVEARATLRFTLLPREALHP